MRTTLDINNPHSRDRYGYAWQQITPGSAHLDFGCDDGFFMNSLADRKLATLIGIECRREAVQAAQEQYPHLDVRHSETTVPLDFPDNTFDSITLLDVLEHIYEQPPLLDELHRILKPSGRLIITVPALHVFSGLDRGNLQVLFPRLFRWYYLRRHTQAEYDYHYGANPDNLVGCTSAQKKWHEHFSRRKLRRLLTAAQFTDIHYDGAGLFTRLLDTIDFILRRPRILQRTFNRLKTADRRYYQSANLFATAQKPSQAE